MDFMVNGTQYLLTYDSSNERWLLLTPGQGGFRKVEVFGDASLPDDVVMIAAAPMAQQPVN
jgi:hypothetical protein